MIDQDTLDKIRAYKVAHPDATYDALAAEYHVSKSTVVKAFKSTSTGTSTVIKQANPGSRLESPLKPSTSPRHLLVIAEPVLDRGLIVRFKYKKFDDVEWVELEGNTIAAVLDHLTSQGYSLVSITRVHGSELRFSKPFQGEYEVIFQR